MYASRERSLVTPLTAAFAALVVYASLYPFAGWRWPGGSGWAEVLRLPWPRYRILFDIWTNLAGYAPLGFLLCAGRLRHGGGGLVVAGLVSVALASALSYAMEVTQQFIPGRYPSAMDWALNSTGALLGALAAWAAHALGLFQHWGALRDRWFVRRHAGALALLLLWPVGLLFPAPFALGLGLTWERVQDGLVGLLLDVPWAQDALEWVSDLPTPLERPPLVVAGLGTGLSLLGTCLLAYAVMRPGWRRWLAALALAGLGLGTTTLSATLNFGPVHALGWLTPEVLPAVALALLLALPLAWVGARAAAALGLVLLSAQFTLVAQFPADPYFAVSLQAWEQGQFIHFYGLAQWVGWLWPFAAIAWLLARVTSKA